MLLYTHFFYSRGRKELALSIAARRDNSWSWGLDKAGCVLLGLLQETLPTNSNILVRPANHLHLRFCADTFGKCSIFGRRKGWKGCDVCRGVGWGNQCDFQTLHSIP